MPRRRVAQKREILPDPKYGSKLISRFINVVMENGKKAVAEKIVYGALEKAVGTLGREIKVKTEQTGDEEGGTGSGSSSATFDKLIAFFEQVLNNVRPAVEVRSRRVGGATYQVPVEVRPERSIALAMRWLVQCARQRNEKGMVLRLAGEMRDAFDEKGNTVKKCQDTHRMAEANKAFAHFRWN